MTSPRYTTTPDTTPHDATFRCEIRDCRRRTVVTEAQNLSNATIALQVMGQGWVLHPQVLCPLHAATREAYRRPVRRRAGRAAAPTT